MRIHDEAPSTVAAQEASCFDLWVKDSGRGWGKDGAFILKAPAGLGALVASYVQEGRHNKLADFDDHLDDVTRDWTNKGLLS